MKSNGFRILVDVGGDQDDRSFELTRASMNLTVPF